MKIYPPVGTGRCAGRAVLTAFVISILAVLALMPAARAQQETEPGSEPAVEDDSLEFLYYRANDQAQAGDYKAAIATFEKILEMYGKFALEDYGPAFGGIYFDYGSVLLQVQEWAKARDAFKKCAVDFKTEGSASKVETINRREKLALFQWGYAEHQLGNPAEALKLYEQYVASKPDPSETQKIAGAYTLRLGTSLVAVGRLQEGSAEIQKLFENRQAWGVTPQFLMQGVLELGLGWIEQSRQDPEGVAKEAHSFLDKFGPYLELSPFDKERFGFSIRLKKLGYEAAQQGLHTLALRFYSMIPNTHEVISDLQGRSKFFDSGVPEAVTQAIAEQQEKLTLADPPEVDLLRLVAASWDGLGNAHAAWATYTYLESDFPKSEYRPQILHEAARFSTRIADYSSAQYYGEKFLKDFPDHELRFNVETFMLQSLFTAGEYDRVLRIADGVRERFKVGDEQRELADHLYGLCLYYQSKFPEAQPELDAFVKNYPDSPNLETARYYRASNNVILANYRVAADLLDGFLKDYPQARLLDIALLDRSTCHFNLEEYSDSVEAVNRLIKERPESQVRDRALNLKGDALRVLADRAEDPAKLEEEAKQTFVKAAEAGKALENKLTVAEGLAKAADIAVNQEKWEEAVTYYDSFFPDYTGNLWEPQISVFTMPALTQVGRTEDGLKQLEKMINYLGGLEANDENVQLLRESIGSYSEASVEARGAEETIKILNDFPGLDPGNKALITWLKIQQAIVLQEIRKTHDRESPEYAATQKRIDQVFEDLRQFDKRDLSDYALQQVGIYLARPDSENPFLAVPYFQELLNREADEFKAPADYHIAVIEMRRNDKASMESARQRLIRVLEKYKDKDLAPEAHLQLGRIAIQQENWAEAEKHFAAINGNSKWFQSAAELENRAESNFYLGMALQKQGKTADALTAYLGNIISLAKYVEWSAQALEQVFQAQWEDAGDDRAKKIQSYKFLRKRVYMLDGRPDDVDPSGALRRMRRRVMDVKTELQLTPVEEQAIFQELGIPLDWTPREEVVEEQP